MKHSTHSVQAIAAVLAVGLMGALPARADGPRRYERLRPDEVARAVERAEQGRGRRDAAESAGARSRSASDDRELLRVERRQRSKLERRRGLGRSADVYHYDYAKNVTLHTVVRLPSGEIEEIRELPGVQLPLTQREIDRATGIAFADPTVRERIGGLFRQRTGEVLVSLDQLHAKAMVFSAESMPDAVNDAAGRCGVDRCAQLLLFTAEHVTVEVIPIVDLTTGELVQVLDF
ncbi:MAG: hypothetical protein ACQGVK_15495 [Myxococcota bacterium]